MPYRLEETAWRALLTRAVRHGWRAQIVGGHGSGKTTLIEELAARLCREGLRVHRFTLHDWDRGLPLGGVAADAVVLCDGAELLGAVDTVRLRWRARLARGLIVTVHRASAWWGPVLHRCNTSPALLQQVVGWLGQELAFSDAIALHARHNGDLRRALRELYDRVGAHPPN